MGSWLGWIKHKTRLCSIFLCHIYKIICFVFVNCNHCCFCCGHPFTMLGVSLSLAKIKYNVCVWKKQKKKRKKIKWTERLTGKEWKKTYHENTKKDSNTNQNLINFDFNTN